MNRCWMQWCLIGFGSCLLLFIAFIIALLAWVDRDVQRYADLAAQESQGNEVEALMAYIESGDHTPREKTHAVWALGHLHDPRAVPLLESLKTGGKCDHYQVVCQSEVQKALDKCTGKEPNLLFWRRNTQRGQAQ